MQSKQVKLKNIVYHLSLIIMHVAFLRLPILK